MINCYHILSKKYILTKGLVACTNYKPAKILVVKVGTPLDPAALPCSEDCTITLSTAVIYIFL